MQEPEVAVSASQWETFQLCQRMWGYVYLEGLRGASGTGAALGSATHAVLEAWGITGSWAGEGKPLDLARSASPLLSRREDLTGIERYFYFTVDGVVYRGYKDFEERGLFGDYKTSKDPKKYGMTPEALLTNAQALIYAREHFHAFPEEDLATARWIYIPTVRGKPYAISAIFTKSYTVAKFTEKITPVSLRILDARKQYTRADQLPTNLQACHMFGGCTHAAYCERGSVLKSCINKEKTMNLRDRLKAIPTTETALPTINAPETAHMAVDEKIVESKETLAKMEAPKEHKVVTMIRSGITVFTRKKDSATDRKPYVGLRTWNVLARDGVATFTLSGEDVVAALPKPPSAPVDEEPIPEFELGPEEPTTAQPEETTTAQPEEPTTLQPEEATTLQGEEPGPKREELADLYAGLVDSFGLLQTIMKKLEEAYRTTK